MNKITTAVLAALVMSPPVVASVNEPLVPFWSCYQQLLLTLDKLDSSTRFLVITKPLKRIAVYCGSSSGDSSLFKFAATELGALIASRGIALVYGGARIGLMGAVADAALASGGDVIGVIPEALILDEVVHTGLTHLEVVGSMHERKGRMLELADAVVAMPGGLGTLEELFEALTCAQLRFHAKPIGMLNLNGYFDALLRFLDHSVSTGFLTEQNRMLLQDATTPKLLLHRLMNAP